MTQSTEKWVPAPLSWPARAILDALHVTLLVAGFMTLVGEELGGEEWSRRSYFIFGGLAVLFCLGKEAYLVHRKRDA